MKNSELVSLIGEQFTEMKT